MSETETETPQPELPRPELDAAGREVIDLDPAILASVQARTWRRRYDAEADRVESIETAFEQARRQLAAAREMLAAPCAGCVDRDTEIQALRERLDALEPATVPIAPMPEAEPPPPSNGDGRRRPRKELPSAPAT